MQIDTHKNIDTILCGKVTKLEEGYAEVLLHTTRQMAVDAQGLVHGGFVFGAADHAAMVAVNDPFVVLGASECRFLAPVQVGDVIVCKATVQLPDGRKRVVEVTASVDGKDVFLGSFMTFVLDSHVLP